MTTYCNCKAKDRDGQHMAWCSALSQREAAAEVREKMNRCLAFIADCERHGSIDHGIAFELVNILTALSPSPELPAGGQRETACRCEDPNVCQSCPDRAALPAPAPHAEVRERKRVNLSGTDFLSGDETRKIDRALSPSSERETGK